MSSRIVVAGLLALAVAAPARAQPAHAQSVGGDCFAGAAPRLIIERKTVPVALDTQRTIAALSTELAAGRGRLLGHAQVNHLLQATMILQVEPRGAAFCARPTEVRLIMRDVKREILIAREVAGDACMNREVMDHEQRHIRADEQAVDTAIAGAQRGLSAVLAQRRSPPRATPEAAEAAARDAVEAWLNGLRDVVETEGTRLNAVIDSPDEYRRLANVCGRRAGALAAVVEAPPRLVTTAEPPRGAPINPAPPLPPAPVFRGTIETIANPLVVKLKPLAERALVSVTTPAGAPNAREVSEVRLTVARQGGDLVQQRRPIMAARGLAGRWVPAQVVTDELGALKAVTEAAPPGPHGDVSDPLQVFAHELAPRLARALAEIEQPRFPARGVRGGDVVNSAKGDDGVVRYDSWMTVRGVATIDRRRVLVVDHTFSIATIGPSLASHGYALIDLETGVVRYADRLETTLSGRVGDTTPRQARVITTLAEPSGR